VTELTIATLNLRELHDRYWKREPLLVAGLRALDADIVCLQEAMTFCAQARLLAWRIGRHGGPRYLVYGARKAGFEGLLEGIALLSRQPLRDHRRVVFGHGRRVAQSACEPNGLRVVNTHLEHGADDVPRVRQVQQLLQLSDASGPVVLAGDLNATSDSPAMAPLSGRFRSAYAVVHGREPGHTAPSWGPGRAIDHILVSPEVEVLEAGTALDAPVNGVWPSDHVAVWAKLRF
jgi:endonuclease/exonuclease/phosphatase family metal-dependent hydrolase